MILVTFFLRLRASVYLSSGHFHLWKLLTMAEANNKSRLTSAGTATQLYISIGHAVRNHEKMESFFLKEQLTDVVLVAGTRRIPAHRLLLSAASGYFSAMFTNDLKEATQKEIELQNVDGDALWALINFCYTGQVEIKTKNIKTLLETANTLQLKEVVEGCCRFMEKQLHPSNCIGIRRFADSLGCPLLSELCKKYTNDHFVEIIENEEFLNLSVDELTELLGSDELRVLSEEDVFRGLQSWLEHDVENRRVHVSVLVKLIRFPLLSPSIILDEISTNPMFQDNTECLKLIVEAFNYHHAPEKLSMLQSPRTRPRNTLRQVYVWGHENGSCSLQRYNAKLNKWTVEEKINVRRSPLCRMAEFKGKLYIVGGNTLCTVLNTVQCYDIKEKTLRNLPPMGTLRMRCGVAVLGGSLYVVGGENSSGCLNIVERLDLQSEKLSSVSPMSEKRDDCGVAVLNGKLYAVGGICWSGKFSALNTVECYDPDTDKWMSCASMGTARFWHGVGVLNGFLYAVGGGGGIFNPLNSVERYDPSTNTWTKVASMKYARFSLGVCVLDGKLFAVGGNDGENDLNAVEVYDAVKDKWEEVAPLTACTEYLFAMVME